MAYRTTGHDLEALHEIFVWRDELQPVRYISRELVSRAFYTSFHFDFLFVVTSNISSSWTLSQICHLCGFSLISFGIISRS
jgi:hypothetical protein